METLHHFRSLAQSVSLLLSYYLSVAQPPEPTKNPDGTETAPQTPLETLFVTRTTREGRTKLAVILRRLSALAKDVVENAAAASNVGNAESEDKVNPTLKADLEKAERVREEVTRFSEQFEKEILRLFDKSYRKGDIKMMAVSHLENSCAVDSFRVTEDSDYSIVRRRYKASTGEHHAYKCMSINTISLSPKTAFWKRQRQWKATIFPEMPSHLLLRMTGRPQICRSCQAECVC